MQKGETYENSISASDENDSESERNTISVRGYFKSDVGAVQNHSLNVDENKGVISISLEYETTTNCQFILFEKTNSEDSWKTLTSVTSEEEQNYCADIKRFDENTKSTFMVVVFSNSQNSTKNPMVEIEFK